MNPSSPTADRDERLAGLLADLADRQRRGLPPDVEALAREHPDLADELRALWATAQFTSAFARPLSLNATLPHPEAAEAPASSLPRPFGDYELLEELGRGGMGVVYKARQKSLNRPVALKVIRDVQLASDTDRARFKQEAEAAARLRHPNIVTVHEVGSIPSADGSAGQPYFVMEFVEGQTLAQLLAESGPLPPREAAALIAQVARAVQHAHEQGILHRDLKPSNILLSVVRGPSSVDREGASSAPANVPGPVRMISDNGPRTTDNGLFPKITDFGLAKNVAPRPEALAHDGEPSLTQTGAIVGTPSYMAPEQATGRKDLTPATDVYALGAILYECLTGRPPFRAANPFDALMMVLEQEPLPPSYATRGIDPDIELICLKCLQKPPGLRYPTAAALAADLEAYVQGESLSASASGMRYFLARLMRETHHAAVLENWGLLWMWHSLQIFLLCLLTQVLAWSGVSNHETYLAVWSVGLITWGVILWQLRRRAGPVLFVERQIAHAWAAGVCASIAMFVIEVLIPLPALTLSPAIAVAAGMVFVFKAGILSGRFYLWAAAMFATAALMPLVPMVSVLLFGTVSALSFFLPGVKYYRLRRRNAGRT